MIKNFLQNKTVGVVAPAGRINPDMLNNAVKIWQNWGAKIKVMPHITGYEDMFFSAPANLRANDFNTATADDEIDFIICARGGYGCAALDKLIDWDLLAKKNKPVIGYSDITALHQMMLKHNAGIPISGAMFLKAPELFAAAPENAASFICALNNGKQILNINAKQPYHGKFVVANLAVLASLCGTELLSDLSGKLLILEDLNEPAYKIHRMMNQLAQSGIFNKISALGTGEFIDCGIQHETDNIFRSFAESYNLPLYRGLPIGHGRLIYALNMLNDISLL